jgi:hypothetical protein
LNPVCEIYIRGKQTQNPMPKYKRERKENILELIHCDLCSPIQTMSAGKILNFIKITNDATRWCEFYFLRHKNYALHVFIC